MTTTTETIAIDDHAAAATTATAPAAPRTSATAGAAHTALESTDRDLGDTPGGALAPAPGRRVPDKTLRLHRILRRSRDTDTRVPTLALPPGPAHGHAPGPAVNLEAVKVVEVIF